MRGVVSALSAVLLIFVFVAARPIPPYPGAQTSERLCSVTFSTSCAADIQKPFERAVSLLHSFVYEQAQPQFEDVFKKDPHCAIALWGEAMSIYYPLLQFNTAANSLNKLRKSEPRPSANEAILTLWRRPACPHRSRSIELSEQQLTEKNHHRPNQFSTSRSSPQLLPPYRSPTTP